MHYFKSLLIIVSVIIAGTTVACGASGSNVEKTVKVKPFTEVETLSWVDIELTVGPSCSVKIVGKAEDVDKVVVKQSGQKIVVDSKPNKWMNRSPKAKVIMTTPDVTSMTTRSSGDIDVKGTINANGRNVTATALSSGDIDINGVNCKTLTLVTKSSGDIELNNAKASKAIVTVMSSGDIQVKSITAEDLEILGNSSGDIDIKSMTAQTVIANSNSSGDIKLKGRANRAVLNSNSAGDIDASGLKAKSGVANANSSGDVKCNITDNFSHSSSRIGEVHNLAR